MTKEIFDADYFERGVPTGKSLYENYRWLPEQTIKFAHRLIKTLELREGDRVLDYGCAKGNYVRALRILDIEGWGCDISKYAISQADKGVPRGFEIADYLSLMEDEKIPFNEKFRQVYAKDVFEHMTKSQLEKALSECGRVSDRLFVIVPLGDGERFIIPSDELDITHVQRQPREWWEKQFENNGWNVDGFKYKILGMKENWKEYEKGNGFFFLKK